MNFPLLPKRKADTVANGIFLILLGVLFYTGQWWPGILFALGLTFAVKQYLTGRRLNFFITIVFIGILGLLTLSGKVFSLFFPVLLIAVGIYLIVKECVPRGPSGGDHSSPSKPMQD